MFVTYITTLGTLITLDALWLLIVAKSFYAERLAHLMAPNVIWWPIFLFYPLYALGITLFVLSPNTQAPLSKIAILAACFGTIAYATYDLTNHATLKNWPLSVTLLDISWGALVTTIACIGATLITRYFAS